MTEPVDLQRLIHIIVEELEAAGLHALRRDARVTRSCTSAARTAFEEC